MQLWIEVKNLQILWAVKQIAPSGTQKAFDSFRSELVKQKSFI